MKINLHIEADSVDEYLQALRTLSGSNVLEISGSVDTLTDYAEQQEAKRKRRTKAEIEQERLAEEAAKVNLANGVAPEQQSVATPVIPVVQLTEKAVTLDDLRAIVLPINVEATGAGKKGVQEIIASVGAPSFTKIPEEKYAEAKAKFLELAETLLIDLSPVTA